MTPPRRIDLAVLPPAEAPCLAAEIAAAGLICFPTDTVYGIGGQVAPAVREALLAAKGRESGRPLQVVYPSLELLEASLALGPRLLGAVRRLLPGPLTLLLPYPAGLEFPPPGQVEHEAQTPDGERPPATLTLGVRVPAWPPSARVLASLPFALLGSSANRSGSSPACALDEVDQGVLDACGLALDAGPVDGRASTVVDLSVYARDRSWRILRQGIIDAKGVAALLAGAGEECGSS